MLVTTGRACAPIAAIVATSPAEPPGPLGSFALKLMTHGGAGCSCNSAGSASVVGVTALMQAFVEGRAQALRTFGRTSRQREECCVWSYEALNFRRGPCLQSVGI